MQLDREAYEAYANHTKWKSLATGSPLPQWDQLSPQIQTAWRVSSAWVIGRVKRHFGIKELPNAVKQTTPTNCFRACVATILNLPIEVVPVACDGASWDWDAFQDWLATRGLQAIEIGFGSGGTIYPVRKPVPCIVTGESPRECTTGRHAVVGELLGLEGFRLLHDPHPAECWIDGEPTHAVFFVPIQ